MPLTEDNIAKINELISDRGVATIETLSQHHGLPGPGLSGFFTTLSRIGISIREPAPLRRNQAARLEAFRVRKADQRLLAAE